MILRDMVNRFESEAPFAVMVRATLENALAAERIDAIFEATAERQRNDELLFSTVADIMGSVACRIHPSVHAAYQARVKEMGVTVKAVYDKLQRVEPRISRAVVRDTVPQLASIVRHLGNARPPLLPGYQVRILDGNHLRRTERRIEELRHLNAAPLPGQALAVLDPDLHLIRDVFPCEDGHAQERSLLSDVLETVQPRELWIADRNFCTVGFLSGIMGRKAYFAIRLHGGFPEGELVGKRKRVATTETGVVHEQSLLIEDEEGHPKRIRRITVSLHEPTRDGDTEIHILTNLPKKVTAVRVAQLYQKRWRIETAFQELAQNLHGEVVTLGYPKAALFAFCMALLSYNVYSVIQAALRAVHGAKRIEEEVSLYYIADEIAHCFRGMMVALPSPYWTKKYAPLSPQQMARELRRLATGIDLRRYKKHKRTPKQRNPRVYSRYRGHVSTARIIAQRSA